MMLDYVDARYVMDKLDHLGPENWQDQFVDRLDGSVRCGIGLLIGGDWVWKWDVGTVSDIEPEKGSYSEAFKRAGVKWGIGRDLYGHKPTRSAPQPTTPAPRPVAPVVAAALAAQPADSPFARLVQAEVDAGFLMPPEAGFAPGELDAFFEGGQGAAPRPVHHFEVGELCPKHNAPWKGQPGDLYHKSESGGYCRPDGQPRKPRS
jgi:hypothetical protein